MDAFENIWESHVAVAPVSPTAGTTMTITTGDGARVPARPVTLLCWPEGSTPSRANAEFLRVTGVAGDVITVTRMAEAGPLAARSIGVGDHLAQVVSLGLLTQLGEPVTNPDGSYGTSSDALTAVVAAHQIISLSTSPIVAKKFAGLWGFMHSYGGGPTGFSDLQQAFWRRWAATMNVPNTEIQVVSRGGVTVFEPRADDTHLGVGDLFVQSSPDHMYAAPGLTAPNNSGRGAPGIDMLLLGFNDAIFQATDLLTYGSGWALNAFTHVMRAIMGVRRQRSFYPIDYVSGATGDAAVSVTGAGWGAVLTDKPYVSGRKHRITGTAGDSISFRLPATYDGEPILFDFLAGANVSTLLNLAMTTASIVVQVSENANSPQSGSYELLIGTERILVDAVAGSGVQNLNVHGGLAGRGQGGTTIAPHLVNAFVTRPQNAYVDWLSSTAPGVLAQATSGVAYGAMNAAGRTVTAGQGRFVECQAQQRFTGLSHLDAGKTITATFRNPTGIGAGADVLDAVCFRIEDPDPNSMFLIDHPRFNWSYFGALAETYTPQFNAALVALAAEVPGSTFIVPVAAEFAARLDSTLVTTIIAGTTTIHIKPVNAARCEIDIGHILRFGNEEVLVDGGGAGAGTAIDKTNPNDWALHVQRAYIGVDAATGTAASSAAIGYAAGGHVYDTKPWRPSDRTHPSDYGHDIFAEVLYSTVNAAPASSVHQVHSGSYKGSSRLHGWANGEGWPNAAALGKRGGRANRTMQLSKEWAHSLMIPGDGIITGFGFYCRTGTTGAFVRFGTYTDGDGAPGQLLYDTGAAYGPGKLAAPATGVADTLVVQQLPLYLPVKGGRHWFSLTAQDVAILTNGVRGVSATDVDTTIPLNSRTMTLVGEITGVSRTGVVGALGDWGAPFVADQQFTEGTINGPWDANNHTYAYETAAVPLVFVFFEMTRGLA